MVQFLFIIIIMARFSKEKLKELAKRNSIRVNLTNDEVTLYHPDGSIMFNQKGGQKISKAFETLKKYEEIQNQSSEIEGSIRPLATYRNLETISTNPTDLDRNYDLEIDEEPVRSPCLAHKLIDIRNHCSVANAAIELISLLVFTSYDGDEIGYTVSPYDTDGETKIDTEVYEIVSNVIKNLIGGVNLISNVVDFLFYGDSFSSIGFEFSKGGSRINKLISLPTWEMFRVVDNQDNLLRYEQRRYLSDTDGIKYLPISVVHWRFNRRYIYGTSLFQSCLRDWDNLKEVEDDLKSAIKAVGVNPNIHMVSEELSQPQMLEYKKLIDFKRQRGEIIYDYVIPSDGKIQKLSSTEPNLTPLLDAVKHWNSKIVTKTHVPPYLLGELSAGANELSNQPALIFVQFVNSIRQTLSSGIRHICDLELALNDIPRERWVYNLKFPQLQVNVFDSEKNPDEQTENIEDLDDSFSYNNSENPLRTYSEDDIQTMVKIQRDLTQSIAWGDRDSFI